MDDIIFPADLMERFVLEARRTFPRKLFGYFLAAQQKGPVEEFIVLHENVRDEWSLEFRQYGQYFEDHADAGYVSSPEETYRVERYIRDSGLCKVGVFHSHSRHPAILTSVDADFHPSTDLWHLLIVLRNPHYPQVRAFKISAGKKIRELAITVVGGKT